MLKIPSRDLEKLIDAALAKHQWTQERLAEELDTSPETVSRWKAGSGIHKVHYEELKRLANEEVSETPVEPVGQSVRIPFDVTIPRGTLKISMDPNGNIRIHGELVAKLGKKEE